MVSNHGWDWNTVSGPPCAWETGKDAEKYHITTAWLDRIHRSGISVGAKELEAPTRIPELEAAAASLSIQEAPPTTTTTTAQTFELIGRVDDSPPDGGWDIPPARPRADGVDAWIWTGVKTFTVPALKDCPAPEPQELKPQSQRNNWAPSSSAGGNHNYNNYNSNNNNNNNNGGSSSYRGRKNGGGNGPNSMYYGRGRGNGRGGRGRGRGGHGAGGYQGNIHNHNNPGPAPAVPAPELPVPKPGSAEALRIAEEQRLAWENAPWGTSTRPRYRW